MGWTAIYRNGKIEREDDPGVGRPVEAGNNGELLVIAQEDYGHKVAVDLSNGIIAFEYKSLGIQNGTIELVGPGFFLHICDETNIAGDLLHIRSSIPDEKGDYTNTFEPLLWRPIWFTRVTAGVPTKIIGAQTTLPEVSGGRNVKKMVMLFADGRVGID